MLGRLKTLTRSEGRIRLSEDDGPAATEFLGDDFDDDNVSLRSNDTLRTGRVGGHSANQGGDVARDGGHVQPT
jgi:hypothetical protein